MFGKPNASFCGTARAKNWFQLHKTASEEEIKECKSGLNWLHYPGQASGSRLKIRKRYHEPKDLDAEPERDPDATDSESEPELESGGNSDTE